MDAGAAVYSYDGEGRRMKKTVGSETTYFFYGVGGLLCEFTTTNTGATQASATDRTTYRTSDKLGSAVLIISAAGTVIENNRTLPYGEAWLPEVASTNDKKFTTYQRDQESGLDYAMNRFFGSANGRFVSVDKGKMMSYLPSMLNRYVYAVADPINYTDADGNIISVPPTPPPPTPFPDPFGPIGRFGDVLRGVWERLTASREERFERNVEKERDKALNKLANAKPDCDDLLNTIGVSVGDLSDKLRGMNFEDGTHSSDLIENVVNLAYANATGTTGWTVSKLFANNFPGRSGTLNGWSPPGGTAYLRPSAVSWDLEIHETLHQFPGLDDGEIMKRMAQLYGTDPKKGGINLSGPSSQISDKIKEKCN